MIPDTHAHLDLIEEDASAVVARARAAGVSPIITIGINITSSLDASLVASENDGVYASVGVHPNDTDALDDGWVESLAEIASANPRVVAIGETGLDYYRDRSPAETQKRAFREQLRLAGRLGKAVIVHDREAHADALELLAAEAPDVPVVMHCFSGDRRVLDECVRRGYCFSFAGPVTFKNAAGVREMAALVPEDSLLCETDAPFLSPDPFRGKPNVPERVRYVAGALAGARGLTLEQLEPVLAANTSRVFGIPVEAA